MTPQKRSALTVVAAGLVMSLGCFLLNGLLAPEPTVAHMFALGITFGFGIFLLGCVFFARAKGRPWFFGLLGLLSCVGLAILWFLPDAPARS